MLRDFLLKLCKAFNYLKENLALMKDASLTAMENEGSILYSQGISSQNKESSLMVKRVATYCLIFVECTHMLDDRKTHASQSVSSKILYSSNHTFSLRVIIYSNSVLNFKRGKGNKS